MKLFRLPEKRPTELVTIKFSYTRRLAESETLVAPAAVSVSVRTGTDAAAGDMLVGTPVLGADHVLAMFDGGVAGTQYLLACLATTSTGQKLALEAILPVADPR